MRSADSTPSLTRSSMLRRSSRGFSGVHAWSPGSDLTPQRADLRLNNASFSSSLRMRKACRRMSIAATEAPHRCFRESRLSKFTGSLTSSANVCAGRSNAPANWCACLSMRL